MPTWEAAESPPYRSRAPEIGENSHYQNNTRRRYPDSESYYNRDERRHEEDKPQSNLPNRFDRFSRDHSRHEVYDRREQEKGYNGGKRRALNPRGGFKAQSYRGGPHQNYVNPWQTQRTQGDEEAAGYSKGKVKLVDY